ncbi:hypothetical protein [Rugamonas apoptosis]|uniref:Uncharacterized protein n=1 Tax=Rugamonas apoptosis TaxID=2758570 RepID=A0A7W2IKP7_9BURK|nr:hypothetical protein [Rugamonas apoptosis]MBA5687602.1 hypothetical protein [Rugamonas apoptosis]
MKQVEDTRTLELFDPAKRGRGKPRGPAPAMTAAQRQQARRDRLVEAGKGMLTVEVSQEVIDALDAFVRFKDETKGSVVDRVLRDRLLRKR